MPATRVTLASNTNQSQKTPFLIPANADYDPNCHDQLHSCRAAVLKAAQSRLRLKRASRIFIAGIGRELVTADDWRDALKNDDATLLISIGEEYVGLIKAAAPVPASTEDEPGSVTLSDEAGREPSNASSVKVTATISNLADSAIVDPLALTQLCTTAQTLPGLIHAVAQPDLHPGTKFPIGAVFVSRGWIHPPLIGGDVGCGMAWYRTRLDRNAVEGSKGKRVAEKLRGLEGAWRGERERRLWLHGREGLGDNLEGPVKGHDENSWDSGLGTIGAGNHFAELQIVNEYDSYHSVNGSLMKPNDVLLLVHSGSRGYGTDILRLYTSSGKTSLPAESAEAESYLREHDRACSWARRNRDLIALRFLSCLEPGNESWSLGTNECGADDEPSGDALLAAREAVERRKVVDIWHNNVERTMWPPRPSHLSQTVDPSSPLDSPSLPEQYPVFIHRKGAAPTHDPATSLPLPLLPLPGSRATPTLILRPTFSPATAWGLHNALSLAHGAGRAMSRTKAATYVAKKYKGRAKDLLQPLSGESRLGQGGGRAGGTWVVCDDKALVWEEAPEAYKDVLAVGQDLERSGAAEVSGWCRAVVSYKVRHG